MFKSTPNPILLPRPVAITRPGEVEKGTLTLTYKHMGRDALRAWQKRVAAGTEDGVKLLAEVITEWDVVNDDEQPIAFSEAALRNLVNDFHDAPVEIYHDILKALPENRTKNSG